MKSKYTKQSGNALWFILLAVALLGFLTAVVSRTGSSVEQSGSVEQNRVKASALLRYTLSIQTAIQQMTMNGLSENELDFSAIDSTYDNPNCAEERCKVFSMSGGGIAYRSAADVLGSNTLNSNWVVNGSNRLYQTGCDDAQPSCNELLLLLSDVPDAVCLQINAVQAVTNPSGAPPQQNGVVETPAYVGVFSGNNSYLVGGTDNANESPELQGKTSGCVFDRVQKKNVFYQLLIAR